MTGAQFRRLCLALGGVEHPHFDRAAFRAGEKGNIFATPANDGGASGPEEEGEVARDGR